ncbi:MAG: transposase [Desulfuromonadales bacterium]|nr:transposase [Desulfuromonadales bacterium]
MARLSRLVIPGYPHHVTQRGVRSINIFSSDEDRYAYLNFMAEESERFGLSFLAWCLMDNHVHLIVMPKEETSLVRAVGEAHRRYTRMKNFAEEVRGYLFQGRFGSCVLDEPHLLAAARYVELNPVKAGLVKQAWDYPWSSSCFHCRQAETDPLVREMSLPGMVDDWKSFLHQENLEAQERVLKGTRTGRPVGSHDFVSQLEVVSGRALHPGSPGRPRKEK